MARVPITEAARLLNLSPDSIRRRIRKGDLPALRDNRSQWWVEVPDNLPLAPVPDRQGGATLTPPYAPTHLPMQTADAALIDALRTQVAGLTAQLSQAEAERRSDRAEWQVERTAAQAERAKLLAIIETLAARPEPVSAQVADTGRSFAKRLRRLLSIGKTRS